jgi:hypothetical protein
LVNEDQAKHTGSLFSSVAEYLTRKRTLHDLWNEEVGCSLTSVTFQIPIDVVDVVELKQTKFTLAAKLDCTQTFIEEVEERISEAVQFLIINQLSRSSRVSLA